jgi:DNA polymerase III epsilon subunit-like protein
MTNVEHSKTQSWETYDYAVVDVEGTGAQHREREGIVDICVVPITNGKVGDPSFRELLDPEIEIPSVVSRVHGIKTADVTGRPKLNDVRKDLVLALDGRILIAHNAPVEKRVFSYRLPEVDTGEMLDTLKLAKYAIPSLKAFGLDNLIDHFYMDNAVSKLEVSFGRHSAIFDAMITAYIFDALLRDYFPPKCSLAELLRISNTSVASGQSPLF